MKIAIFLFALLAVASSRPQSGKQYPIKLQPELDNLNIEEYLKNEKLLDLQIKCVIYDGPCDAVGKWVKPRVPMALLGNCQMCTPKQAKGMQAILDHIQEKRPDQYRASVIKYLQEAGISVDSPKNGTSVPTV